MRWFLILFAATCLQAHEKLDSKYQVSFGNGEIEITEYFSLSCKKCLEWFINDFEEIKKDYIETNRITWTFHPTPADLPTLQMMVCMDCLSPEERPIFFQALMECIGEKGPKYSCQMMQSALKALGYELPDLDKIDFLIETAPFQDALEYLKQKDVMAIVPTLEMNGQIYDRTPNRKFLDEMMRNT